MVDIPYFMENDNWYYFDGKKYVLTDIATEKAKASYKKFYEDIERNE